MFIFILCGIYKSRIRHDTLPYGELLGISSRVSNEKLALVIKNLLVRKLPLSHVVYFLFLICDFEEILSHLFSNLFAQFLGI